MPKVLLTSTSYPPSVGGAQMLSHRLATQVQNDSDFRFHVVCQWTEDRQDFLLGSTLFGPRSEHEYVIEGVAARRMACSLSDRLLLAPSVLAYPVFGAASVDMASRVLKRRLRESARGIDLVQNVRVGREFLSFASWELARELRVPFVFQPLHHPRWEGWFYTRFIELYRRADAVMALTKWERDTYIRLGVDPQRISVTGSGPILADSGDGARFRSRYDLGDDPLVLFLGQKYSYKGLRELMAAAPRVWRAHPKTRFVLVGPSTKWSRNLQPATLDQRYLNLDRVTLEEKTDALLACDVLCVPSSQESFGIVYTEAWLTGSAVIAGPAPAIREVVDDGVDGFIVNQDAEEISQRITELLSDGDLRAEMAERGRKKVLERYTWESVAKEVIRLYRHLLGSSSR